jgi:hypothetical protein
MATKSPADWLRLLCRDWSEENEQILSTMDERFLRYKSYLKGRLTSQLLCRLSSEMDECNDFWKILGVKDEFDRAHIVANVERFCSLYNIRGSNSNDVSLLTVNDVRDIKASQKIARKRIQAEINARIREGDTIDY